MKLNGGWNLTMVGAANHAEIKQAGAIERGVKFNTGRRR
jgi:hypothetical protein